MSIRNLISELFLFRWLSRRLHRSQTNDTPRIKSSDNGVYSSDANESKRYESNRFESNRQFDSCFHEDPEDHEDLEDLDDLDDYCNDRFNSGSREYHDIHDWEGRFDSDCHTDYDDYDIFDDY